MTAAEPAIGPADASPMRWMPLYIDLRGKAVLVVGGGEVASRKVRLLRSAGARVSVLAPIFDRNIEALAAEGGVDLMTGVFEPAAVAGQRLVVAATDDREANHAVARAAESAGILCNVVDDGDASSAIVPSIVDRSPLVVAISTGGAAPMLARAVRERIESQLDETTGALASLLQRWRTRITQSIHDSARRREFYSQLLRGELSELLRHGRHGEAEARLRDALTTHDAATPRGRVLLVGAGPGDAGLLTLRALRALQEADVVLHDKLVSPDVLALVRRDAEREDVGKRGGGGSTPQAYINDRMLAEARRGRTVVRLKGGDPFVFGRGGEEREFLLACGIDVEVVPGITAAIGAGASAGIALTHRGRAAGLRLISAESGTPGLAVDWANHAASRDTLAIYMGLSAIETLAATLQQHGRAGDTPVALVANATRRDQRVLRGNLRDAATLAREGGLRTPVLFIVGEVAAS
jgi:uroporphyrin-III C-methyltransferase/precorrin-2 dehydrogenase/sirohydrochlorin ferrochelatase